MTERAFWKRIIRPALHDPPRSLAYKVQDAFVKGLPDVVAMLEGRTFWLEIKTLDHAPVRAGTDWKIGVTMEQRRWLNAWNRAEVQGDPDHRCHSLPAAMVLLWVDREKKWYLMAPDMPENLAQEDFKNYVLAEGDKNSLREAFKWP